MSDQANSDPDFKWPEPTEEELRQRRKELIAKIKQAESNWPKPQPIETLPDDDGDYLLWYRNDPEDFGDEAGGPHLCYIKDGRLECDRSYFTHWLRVPPNPEEAGVTTRRGTTPPMVSVTTVDRAP